MRNTLYKLTFTYLLNELCCCAAGTQPKLFLPPPPETSDHCTLPEDDFDDFGKAPHNSSRGADNSFSNGYGIPALYRDSDPELRR